jgi:hypothetical protein
MFDSQTSNRLRDESVIFRSQQKHGKLPFILRSTIGIGMLGIPLSYLIPKLLRLSRHSHALAIFVICSALCAAAGYLIGELSWRRGLRLTEEYPEPHS